RLEGEPGGDTAFGPSFGTARPNPSAARVSIPFALAAPGPVEVEVVDVLGRVVRRVLEDDLEAGSHLAEWDGSDESGGAVAAGVYLIRLRSDLGTAVTRVTRLR
ncbi:FlgD immunoglobulin-like domain containing protein, partial [Rubrivirga sp.]|uniref:FlgD immunoglobulin-like domain containing protein n=1 Tax=Rubrivirga sp. TaxID=1885344 RepID=UPI003C785BE3